MIISELYRYPLKGGQAESLSSVTVLGTGFPEDRRWLLVDAKGRFVSQRECGAMARVRAVVPHAAEFSFRDQVLQINANAPRTERLVTVWKDTLPAWDLGDEAAAFFSRVLQRDLRLCVAKDERQAEAAYTESQDVGYYFADAFPYLIISQESLDLLNEKLQAQGKPPVPVDRFRPNIVIKGWSAHAEDAVQTLRIGAVRLRLTKLCSRCNVTTIDQKTGDAGTEPLATLASYRKLGTSKIFFGMNAWVLSGAGQRIALGDAVTIE